MHVAGSLVRPKVVRSVHYCDVTKTVLERAYSDLTSLEAFPHSAIYPTTVNISKIQRNIHQREHRGSLIFHITGRRWQSVGNGIRFVDLQGSSDAHDTGDAGEGTGRPVTAQRGRHLRQRSGGPVQAW